MSSNLAKIDLNNLPAHLRAAPEETTNEFGAGIGSGGLGVPVLSIRGKEFRFRSEGQEFSTGERTLDVILLASRPHVSKRWFGQSYESGSTVAPACASTDGVRPDSGEDRQADKCSTCPRNQFGSKITPSGKKGKECNDYKRLIVLPVIDGVLQEQPVVLDLPWTSLKKSRDDKTDTMFLHEFTGALVRHGIRVPAVVTTLKFTSAEYPQVGFSMARPATEDEWDLIQSVRESDTVQDLLSEEAVEAPGPITETPPPKPAEKPAEKPKAKAEPKPEQPDMFKKPKAKASPPEPEPEPEAAPETAEEPAASGEDPMAEVRKLLGF